MRLGHPILSLVRFRSFYLLIAYRLYRPFTFTSKISSHPFSPGRRGGATAQSALEAGTDPVLVSQIDVRRYRTLLVVYLV